MKLFHYFTHVHSVQHLDELILQSEFGSDVQLGAQHCELPDQQGQLVVRGGQSDTTSTVRETGHQSLDCSNHATVSCRKARECLLLKHKIMQ